MRVGFMFMTIVFLIVILWQCNAKQPEYKIVYNKINPYDGSFIFDPGWEQCHRDQILKWWNHEQSEKMPLVMAREQFPESGLYWVYIVRNDLED